MRSRAVTLPISLSVLLLAGLTACNEGTAPPGVSDASAAADLDVGDGVDNEAPASSLPADSPPSAAPPTSTPPSAADIRTVDLANTTWLYSFSGFDLPLEVKLVNGTATIADVVPITYTLGEVVYGDVDNDGDEDAAALLQRAESNGYEALWYVWLAAESGVEQVKYPIARTGRCGTLVEPPVIGDGAVNLTEYHRIPGLDDNIPCSGRGTGLKKRSITIQSEGPEAWPVQTAPVAAWGGLCAGPKYPDTAPGLVDLWTAPSASAQSAAAAGPDGAIFEQKDSPLVNREGWSLVGFRVFGVESDLGGADMACAWALN